MQMKIRILEGNSLYSDFKSRKIYINFSFITFSLIHTHTHTHTHIQHLIKNKVFRTLTVCSGSLTVNKSFYLSQQPNKLAYIIVHIIHKRKLNP